MLRPACIFAVLLAISPVALAEDRAPFTKNGCSIMLPKGWKTDSIPGATAFVFATSPDADTSNGQQHPATIVIARVACPNADLMDLAKKFQTGQGRDPQNKNYQPAEAPAETTIHNVKTVTFGGNYTSGNKPLQNRVWLITAPGGVYIVTFTSLTSAYQKRLPTAETSVATFTVLDEKH